MPGQQGAGPHNKPARSRPSDAVLGTPFQCGLTAAKGQPPAPPYPFRVNRIVLVFIWTQIPSA